MNNRACQRAPVILKHEVEFGRDNTRSIFKNQKKFMWHAVIMECHDKSVSGK